MRNQKRALAGCRASFESEARLASAGCRPGDTRHTLLDDGSGSSGDGPAGWMCDRCMRRRSSCRNCQRQAGQICPDLRAQPAREHEGARLQAHPRPVGGGSDSERARLHATGGENSGRRGPGQEVSPAATGTHGQRLGREHCRRRDLQSRRARGHLWSQSLPGGQNQPSGLRRTMYGWSRGAPARVSSTLKARRQPGATATARARLTPATCGR